ncbi:hypothetical protein P885DRAFT_76117 [Corynascus similis CBS 632.67]
MSVPPAPWPCQPPYAHPNPGYEVQQSRSHGGIMPLQPRRRQPPNGHSTQEQDHPSSNLATQTKPPSETEAFGGNPWPPNSSNHSAQDSTASCCVKVHLPDPPEENRFLKAPPTFSSHNMVAENSPIRRIQFGDMPIEEAASTTVSDRGRPKTPSTIAAEHTEPTIPTLANASLAAECTEPTTPTLAPIPATSTATPPQPTCSSTRDFSSDSDRISEDNHVDRIPPSPSQPSTNGCDARHVSHSSQSATVNGDHSTEAAFSRQCDELENLPSRRNVGDIRLDPDYSGTVIRHRPRHGIRVYSSWMADSYAPSVQLSTYSYVPPPPQAQGIDPTSVQTAIASPPRPLNPAVEPFTPRSKPAAHYNHFDPSKPKAKKQKHKNKSKPCNVCQPCTSSAIHLPLVTNGITVPASQKSGGLPAATKGDDYALGDFLKLERKEREQITLTSFPLSSSPSSSSSSSSAAAVLQNGKQDPRLAAVVTCRPQTPTLNSPPVANNSHLLNGVDIYNATPKRDRKGRGRGVSPPVSPEFVNNKRNLMPAIEGRNGGDGGNGIGDVERYEHASKGEGTSNTLGRSWKKASHGSGGGGSGGKSWRRGRSKVTDYKSGVENAGYADAGENKEDNVVEEGENGAERKNDAVNKTEAIRQTGSSINNKATTAGKQADAAAAVRDQVSAETETSLRSSRSRDNVPTTNRSSHYRTNAGGSLKIPRQRLNYGGKKRAAAAVRGDVRELFKNQYQNQH